MARLQSMALAHRTQHQASDLSHSRKHWLSEIGCYCYETHIAISGQNEARFEWLVDVFYKASTLSEQPWYPQFLGGSSQPCEIPCTSSISEHQLCSGRFDLGLGKPRVYRQLVSLQREAQTAIICARSLRQGASVSDGEVLAYTLDPNGEVLHWDGEFLHWHHICCTPGPGLLPSDWDRRLMNVLRGLKLDQAERKTYRQEAEGLRDWLQSVPINQLPDLRYA